MTVVLMFAKVLGFIAWFVFIVIFAVSAGTIATVIYLAVTVAYFVYRFVLGYRRKALARSSSALLFIRLKHVSGLEMGNTLCNVYLSKDTLHIENNFTETYFDVPLNRIYVAGRASQIQPAELSMRGAILGDMIDGPVGAVIGAATGGRSGNPNVLLIRFLDDDNHDHEFAFESVWRWTSAFDSLARNLRRHGKHNVKQAG